MAKKQAFAIHDRQVAAFNLPFFCKSEGEACRGFLHAAQNPDTPMSQYPGDYSLFHVGEYDEETAELSPLPDGKRLVTSLIELAAQAEQQRGH